jgi:hypothetical protein
MVRKIRISIAGLMGVVAVAALGSAGLRYSSEAWAGLVLLVTCGALLLGVVGALCREPHERAWWLGFALFGAGYLALAHATAFSPRPLPTITLAEFAGSGLGVDFVSANGPDQGWNSLAPTHRILHCLWALALAALGCLLAGLLVATPAVPAPIPFPEQHPHQHSPVRWKRAAVIGLTGYAIAAMAAAVGRWPHPGIWAGATFLLTCGLLGVAALGAALGRGRDREAWLGAALFGFAYLALTFGKSQLFIVAPHLPTEGMLNRLFRPGGPPIDAGFPDFETPALARVKHQVIMTKLEQPIPFHFPEEVPLEDVLKYIRDATRDVNFQGVPIYVDPIGLRNAEKTMASTVRIDRDAIPVRVGLGFCLKQLDLEFSVRDGFVAISDNAAIPVFDDPVQVVGHSLLALFAAGVGAAAARFLSDRARRREGTARPTA